MARHAFLSSVDGKSHGCVALEGKDPLLENECREGADTHWKWKDEDFWEKMSHLTGLEAEQIKRRMEKLGRGAGGQFVKAQ